MAKTVKVRIPVAVDRDGNWNASGWSGNCDWLEMMDCAMDSLQPGEARYWVEAELALPDVQAVEGHVTKAG